MTKLENNKKTYDLEKRLLDSSVSIINLVEKLPNTYTGEHIAKQLIRSGTSAAPNYGEAQSAESRRDFINKMKLSLKELRETKVWLNIIKRISLIRAKNDFETVIAECNELIMIFAASIKTAEENKRKQC